MIQCTKTLIALSVALCLSQQCAAPAAVDTWESASARAAGLFRQDRYTEAASTYNIAVHLAQAERADKAILLDLLLDIIDVKLAMKDVDGARRLLAAVKTRMDAMSDQANNLLWVRYLRRHLDLSIAEKNFQAGAVDNKAILERIGNAFGRHSYVYFDQYEDYIESLIWAGQFREVKRNIDELMHETLQDVGLQQRREDILKRTKLLTKNMVHGIISAGLLDEGRVGLEMYAMLHGDDEFLVTQWAFLASIATEKSRADLVKLSTEQILSRAEVAKRKDAADTTKGIIVQALENASIHSYDSAKPDPTPESARLIATAADIVLNHQKETAGNPEQRTEVLCGYAASLAWLHDPKKAEAIADKIPVSEAAKLVVMNNFGPYWLARHRYIAREYVSEGDAAGVVRQFDWLRKVLAQAKNLSSENRAKAKQFIEGSEACYLADIKHGSNAAR